jgi:DNA-binding NtrC family response regulator
MDSLMAHSWPGNIRELRHVVERAVLMAQGAFVNPADLGLEPTKSVSVGAIDEMSLEDVERLLIKKALLRFSGNANKAAEALGLSRSALYRRLQKYGL